MANAVYGVVTDRIVSLLERGTVPWHQPWRGGPPVNLVSRKRYRGINPLILVSTGFAFPFWLTYKQAQELGGNVRKGERSTPIVFFKDWRISETDRETGEKRARTLPVLRYYNVFNVAQCEGIEVPEIERGEIQPIDACERIARDMPNAPAIRTGEARAWYAPALDTVNMPARELFETGEGYYATLFHELTHSTGHKSRLDRDSIGKRAAFGSADYSREELIAEMGAAFLCGHAGIETATIENAAAYIAGWLAKLRGDSKLVVQAASAAQRAADYILGEKGGA